MELARIVVVITGAVAAVGCAPFVPVIDVKQTPAVERAAASKVRVLPIGWRTGSDTIAIGPIGATSCKFLLWDPPSSTADAIEQLKIKAHRAGADAVVGTVCDDTNNPFKTNCWNTVTCGGTAVKVTGN